MEIKNAIIESTFLGIEDHGIFTAFLRLNYGGSTQGFGNHNLKFESYRIEYLQKILSVVGVDCWEKLPHKYIRAKCEYNKVHAIGHIIEDRWFDPEKDLKGENNADQTY